MFAVYQLAAFLLGTRLGWYVGFWVYWPVWCVLFPLWAVGWPRLKALFRHRGMGPLAWSLVIIPPAMAFVGRFVLHGDPRGIGVTIAWIAMSFANGILEEVLWRGVYIALFPDNKLWGFAWPTLWFGLWHFGPGSVSGTSAWILVSGAMVFGACLGWVAMKTGSIRWCAVSHVLAGLARA